MTSIATRKTMVSHHHPTDPKVLDLLKEIIELELAGVIRYTHYALMVTGPDRIPQVAFLKGKASESLVHAQRAGEILTGLGGHPSMKIAKINETGEHSVERILEECQSHESLAIDRYTALVQLATGKSILLEEYARSMVVAEEEDLMELRKMVRDLG